MSLLFFRSPKPEGTTIANGSGVYSAAGTLTITAEGRGSELSWKGANSSAELTFVDGLWNASLTAGGTLIFGFHWRSDNAFSNGLGGIRFSNTAGTVLGELRISSAGLLAWRDTSTQRAISVLALTDATDQWIEGKILLATGATGTILVKVDGVTFINTSSVITMASGTMSRVVVPFRPNSGANFCDCLVVCDALGSDCNDLLGSVKTDSLVPTADTADDDFTPSTGTDNYAMVDDATPDGDSTFNESNVLGHKDLFTHTGGVTSADIKGVNINLRCRKAVAGTQGIKGIVSSTGDETKTALCVPTTSYTSYMKTIPHDPDTSAPWLAAALNSAKLGYELTLTP